MARKKRDPRVGRKVYGFRGSGGRYIGKVPVRFFIRKVAQASQSSEHWVRERYCPTGNRKELALAERYAKSHPGKILLLRETGRVRKKI